MKQRIACIVAAPFLLGLVAGSAAAYWPEPPEPCATIPGINCGSMPYLTTGTWIPTTYNWEPNRLPAAWINLRPGGGYY